MNKVEKTPRVLTVLPDFPFPATTGLHLRMMSNLDLVHRVGCYNALLFFSTEGRDVLDPASTPLQEICDDIIDGGQRFPHSGISKAALAQRKVDFLVRGLLGVRGRSYPFSMSYDRIGAGKRIVAEATRIRADYVTLPEFLIHYAEPLRANGFRVIADAADVLTELSLRFLRQYANGAMSRLGLYANYVATRTQEKRFLPLCSEIWATSQDEAEVFSRIAPGINVVVVPNALDEREIQPSEPVEDLTAGFIGTYSYLPNLDAARFLVEKVFPKVVEHYPAARLKLAGAGMKEEDRARFEKLGYVEVLGPVRESNDFYSQCRVIALPVFLRGGVPLKVVEAFARGKAVVGCKELVAGLNVQDGREMLVRDDPEEFAAAICALFADREMCRRLERNAREQFVEKWSRSQAERQLRRSSVLAGRGGGSGAEAREAAKRVGEATRVHG
jgi:glycosyltransferase involved in cell wall biosynthesis